MGWRAHTTWANVMWDNITHARKHEKNVKCEVFCSQFFLMTYPGIDMTWYRSLLVRRFLSNGCMHLPHTSSTWRRLASIERSLDTASLRKHFTQLKIFRIAEASDWFFRLLTTRIKYFGLVQILYEWSTIGMVFEFLDQLLDDLITIWALFRTVPLRFFRTTRSRCFPDRQMSRILWRKIMSTLMLRIRLEDDTRSSKGFIDFGKIIYL